MHRGRGAAGFPATGAWDSVGASTWGLHQTRFVFVGHRNKASDSVSPFVEFPRSGWEIEEQLRARRTSAGVGGSETCTDRDALRLLTMSEGALSRPRGRMPFSPAPR